MSLLSILNNQAVTTILFACIFFIVNPLVVVTLTGNVGTLKF